MILAAVHLTDVDSFWLFFVAQIHHAFGKGLEVLLEVLVELNGIEVLDLKDKLLVLDGIDYPVVEVMVVISPSLFTSLLIILLTLPNLQNIGLLVNSLVLYHRLHIYRNHLIGNVYLSNRHEPSACPLYYNLVEEVDEE